MPQLQGRESLPGQVPVQERGPVPRLVRVRVQDSVRVPGPRPALVSVLGPGQAPELMRGQAPVSALMRVLEWVWVPVQAWIRQQVWVPVRGQAPVLGLAQQPWWRSLPAREQELLPLPMPQVQRWSRVLLRSPEKWLPQWVRLGFQGQRSGRGLHPPKVR